MTFRINKEKDYTTLSNALIFDRNITLSALGLLVFMLAHKDEAIFNLEYLSNRYQGQKKKKDGRDAIAETIKELIAFGYIVRTRKTDEKGRFIGYDYDVYETPNTATNIETPPKQDLPKTDYPNTEQPNTDNPHQLNTILESTTTINQILSSSANSTSDTSISQMQKESQFRKDPDDPTGDTLHDAKVKKEKKVSSESKDEKEKIDKLILFFNRKTNSNYRIETTATRKMILKLLRNGFNAKDFSDVILDRIKVWSTDERMSEYLRPQTIFTEKNFESYLNNARKTKIEIIDNAQNDIQRLERLDPATLTNEELTILAKNGNGLAKQQLKLRR